ncbi:hypothetical protein ACQKWADRAFT_292140 [Trichoderma austrokoningii]
MHFFALVPCVLLPLAAAAPAEMIPVAPLVSFLSTLFGVAKILNQKVTLYYDSDWAGQQFDVRSLKTCVRVTGPLRGHVRSAKLWPNSPPSRLCALFESDDCRPGTEVIFIRAENSKVNIRHNDNVRSVYCLGAQRDYARF